MAVSLRERSVWVWLVVAIVAASCGGNGNSGDAGVPGCTTDCPADHSCTDGLRNGTETDVDCGGSACAACPVGKLCATNADCMTGNGCDATTKHCDADLCGDGITDGAESDADCGGGTCPGCKVGSACTTTADCAVNAGCDVTTRTCDANQCHDGLANGTETDVDCGGATCPTCAVALICAVDSDCASGACDAVSLTCVADPCSDHHEDGFETDLDCGGGTCPTCALAKTCALDTDCTSGACDTTSLACVADHCADHHMDGTETDLDCGGSCSACALAKKCAIDSDCTSSACDAVSLTCVGNQCADHRKDGAETDLDCGGGICGSCAVAKKCVADADCTTNACDALTLLCVANQCADHRQDGSESDVDCGGTCSTCAVGQKCTTNFDCAAGHTCSTGAHVCQ